MMKKTGLIVLLILLWMVPCAGLEKCPEKMQAVMLVKIIPFIKGYDAYNSSFEITVGIFGQHEMTGLLQATFSKISYRINLETVTNAEAAPGKIRVLYIPAGTAPEIIQKLNEKAKAAKILTVCGDPSTTLDFNLTLSFYVNNENPKILINLKSAKEEGVAFSSNLLGLADVRNKN